MLRTKWCSQWNHSFSAWLLVAFRKVLQRIPFAPLDINCLYFLEYTGIPPNDGIFGRSRGSAEVRGATPADLEGMTRCQNTPATFLERFHSNDSCVVAVAEGRIVGYQWFCEHPIHVEERYSYKIEVPADAIYTYDAFILLEHRLTGIWVKFNSLYLRDLMQRLNREKVLSMVDYGNWMSMNTHLRFGYKPFRRVLVVKVFGKSFFLTRALRPEQAALPRKTPLVDEPVTR